MGLFDDTLIIVVSDHGEQMMDHGFLGHIRTLYDELVRVPLIVYDPDSTMAGQVRFEAVETRRVFSTVLDALEIEYGAELRPRGLPVRAPIDARSLGGDPAPAPVFSMVWLPDSPQQWLRFRMCSVRVGGWKLIVDYGRNVATLFDLEADPRELRDVAAENPDRVTELREELDAWLEESLQRQNIVPTLRFDDEQTKKLEELGYM